MCRLAALGVPILPQLLGTFGSFAEAVARAARDRGLGGWDEPPPGAAKEGWGDRPEMRVHDPLTTAAKPPGVGTSQFGKAVLATTGTASSSAATVPARSGAPLATGVPGLRRAMQTARCSICGAGKGTCRQVGCSQGVAAASGTSSVASAALSLAVPARRGEGRGSGTWGVASALAKARYGEESSPSGASSSESE